MMMVGSQRLSIISLPVVVVVRRNYSASGTFTFRHVWNAGHVCDVFVVVVRCGAVRTQFFDRMHSGSSKSFAYAMRKIDDSEYVRNGRALIVYIDLTRLWPTDCIHLPPIDIIAPYVFMFRMCYVFMFMFIVCVCVCVGMMLDRHVLRVVLTL